MTILVTGATGTIGSTLVGELAPGRDVRTFGRRAPAGARRGVEHVDGDERPPAESRRGVEHVDGDVTDLDAVVRAAAGVDTIVHLAGLLEAQDGLRTLEVNVRGTYHVLEAARLGAVKRVVFASSIAVTGCLSPLFVPERVPILETDPCRPASPYATSKLAGEVLCDGFSRAYGLTTVALRLAGVQRPQDWPSPPWERERSPILWTWITAFDAARAIVAAIDAPVDGSVVVNVAAADTCSLRTTADLVRDFLPGTSVRAAGASGATTVAADEPRWPLFDLDRAGRLLAWEPIDRFEDLFDRAARP